MWEVFSYDFGMWWNINYYIINRKVNEYFEENLKKIFNFVNCRL